ncbi:site-2 protease family protein [Citroniella saccharovorans]|uniref:Site-2 protease family protein n=1 Tax=Citroniella saccharovorans TaxID=2053367 RepID=A0AAW9MYP8_9FIRM|nr:site-2 protease family protein [Citroniella saccharovorans]MEB3429599.1 site-2 protease family protein [Citroniella saccharovorans]
MYNAGLAVFNLLPFPPLDGSKVILSFFPKNTQDYILRNEKFLYTILLILIFTGTISKVIQPITSKIIIFFINIVS